MTHSYLSLGAAMARMALEGARFTCVRQREDQAITARKKKIGEAN
jgi:hypothetical protein